MGMSKTATVVLVIFVFSALPGQCATPDNLNIITSYPPQFYQPFIDRYRLLNPEIQVQVLNKKTTAALEEIQNGNSRKFDLFWSSSLDAFGVLKASGKLKRSGYLPQYRTIDLRDMHLHDPDGCYFSFALSSVGFMWNNEFLEKNGLPPPANWESLSDPVYYGHVAMSTPSRSGTTHLIVESILQSMGWQQGWAYLLKTAGNFATITARSFSVPEGIAGGRFGIGFVIDFLAFGEKNANAALDFRYATVPLLMPAGIALLDKGEHREAALRFIDFLLSPQGQEILLDPSINRLPVLADIYARESVDIPQLFRLINQGKTRPYDTGLSIGRYHVVNNLFDQLVTYRLPERRKIWKNVILLQKRKDYHDSSLELTVRHVLSLICELPISEKESIDNGLVDILGAGPENVVATLHKRQLLHEWEEFVTQRLSRAQSLLDEAWEKLPELQE